MIQCVYVYNIVLCNYLVIVLIMIILATDNNVMLQWILINPPQCFQRIILWWINEFGGLTGYSLLLVHTLYWYQEIAAE